DHKDPDAVAERRADAGSIRHLIYHLYPVNDAWRWNIGQMRQRMSLFNGRRIVAAALGPGTATAAEVRDELEDLDVEVLEITNDAVLREMASYPMLLERLAGCTSPMDCHYYGHAKGVTSEGLYDGVRLWTTSMYEALLDHWPAVARELKTHCCVGIWRRHWAHSPGSTSQWHYSGSHRWVRNADLYSRDWRTIDRNWVGSESHPGRLFTVPESCGLYGSFSTQDLGLYQLSEWKRRASAERAAWVAEHLADREEPLLVTVILTAAKQRELVHQAIASVQAQTADAWQLLIMDAGELHAEGAYRRYAADARIQVLPTGETPELRRQLGIQAWAINEAWRRGKVRGDLVVCLCDDDLFDADWLAACLEAARSRPSEAAWYGAAERCVLD
ncbi:MAG: glycosyltransferase family 2 protein, partial [Steroidobacteraceae bacterium]